MPANYKEKSSQTNPKFLWKKSESPKKESPFRTAKSKLAESCCWLLILIFLVIYFSMQFNFSKCIKPNSSVVIRKINDSFVVK